MLVKKLAVPLINEKILQQAEHCTIATAAVSDTGFDFVIGRLSAKCKVELLTSIDGETTPTVLTRIYKHFTDRVALKIYNKNIFHANFYIFDLPFRKSVAFVGSGPMTLEGLKDSEEIFWKISDPKEIESLRSLFVGHYEYAVPVSEAIIREYEVIYPSLKQRDIASRQERQEVLELTTRGFSWDTIKFRNQFFKKEDYITFSNDKAMLDNEDMLQERAMVKAKLLQLHDLLKRDIAVLKLHESADAERIVSGIAPADYPDKRVRFMSIAYGRRDAELKKYRTDARLEDFMTLQFVIRQKDAGIWLMIGKANGSREDREYLNHQMNFPEFRTTFLKLLKSLGSGYWIEVAGDKRSVDSLASEDVLWEHTRRDDWRYYPFIVGQNYAPGGFGLSNDMIATTVAKEFEKLVHVYEHVRHR
jgi:HKD family nuclease